MITSIRSLLQRLSTQSRQRRHISSQKGIGTVDALEDRRLLTFSAATNFAVGLRPVSVTVGDFNGDGRADIASANQGASSVSVRLNDGSGGFSATQNFAVGDNPVSLVTTDLNRDGKTDLAVANYASDSVSVLMGDGLGGFSPSTSFAVSTGPTSLVVGDFNGDANPDLATANQTTHNVSVMLGDGAGSFSPLSSFPVSNQPSSIAIGDFDGNGKSDLAVAVAVNGFDILLGNGSGGFSSPVAVPLEIGFFGAASDLNGDGKSDLVAAENGSSFLNVLINTGTGSFASPVNYTVGASPRFVTIADFNLDGKLDLVSTNTLSNNVSLLLGDGNGTFAAAVNFAVGTRPASTAVGDFNGDGKIDLVSANRNSNNLSVLLNNTNTAPTAVVLTPSTATLAENVNTTAAIELTTIAVTDDGLGTNNLSLSGADASSFEIVGNKLRLKANVSLDFESKPSYSVRVNVDDATVGSSPDRFADFTLTVTNVNDAALGNLVVQNGQSQRSFVRYVDLVFSHGGAELLDLISNNRIQLRRTDLSGNASNFAIPAMVVSGNRIQIDFGAQGVGGNRNSNAADGLYQFWIDTDGDGSADAFASFHRLLGDVNGDSVVDAEDRKKALSFFGQPYSAEADVNGDGLVNSADMSLLTRALGRRIRFDL